MPENTGANTGSSTMKVALIDHHWWYDRRLSTYVPRSVGGTMSTKLKEPWFRCAYLDSYPAHIIVPFEMDLTTLEYAFLQR